jgi:hypothetical protein
MTNDRELAWPTSPTSGQDSKRAPTVAELWDMPLPEAIACARAGLRDARRALEAQLALAMEDEPRDRVRRVGIIQMYLADLAESEARLDAVEKVG